MNTFTKHIPAYFDCDAPTPIPFNTTEELLAIEAVRHHVIDPLFPNFSHFALSDNSLMAIYDDGFTWWVVGFIQYPEQVKLPQWEGGKYK